MDEGGNLIERVWKGFFKDVTFKLRSWSLRRCMLKGRSKMIQCILGRANSKQKGLEMGPALGI